MSATSVLGLARKSLGWTIFLSVLMILAGVGALLLPAVAGIAFNLVVGWLLIFSGVAHFVYAWYVRGVGAMALELLLGIVYVVIGVYLLLQPVAGLAALTLGLAIYLFAEGILEVVLFFRLRSTPGAVWLLFDAVITLILAILIWRTWPSSTDWVIGTLVGISMLFSGLTRLMYCMAARSLLNKVA